MFTKYNSIENTYREKEVEQIYLHDYDNEEYVVQEKVHGANFSFITNGITIKVAKRSGLIKEGEFFSNYEFILNSYSEAIKILFRLVKEDFPNTEIISVFGELFGGHYQHSEVETIKDMVKVQKGVFYSPKNDFYAFDICINQEQYLNVSVVNNYFETVGLFYAKTLFKGSFQKCLDYPNTFQTKIPNWLGLPEIESNICEGVIIKTELSKRFKNGERVIFKNKNEKWSERKQAGSKNANQLKEIKLFSVLEQQTVNYLLSYVSENRLTNVQSKLGEFSVKQIGKIIGLFAQDALVDFKKDYQTNWDNTEKETQKQITKLLNKEASNLVKRTFLYR